VLLSHADRSRFGGSVFTPDARSKGWALVDGIVAGSWRWDRADGSLEYDAAVGGKAAAAIRAEAQRLMAFVRL